jgi:nucleotide-binding universal stress UspA family protein
MAAINKILYPTDMSEHSLVALPLAVDLAKRYNAKLHCLHVLDIEHEFFLEGGYVAPMVVSTPLPVEQMKKAGEEQLEAFIKEHVSALGDSVTRKVITGKPFVEIIRYAREESIDLIVLGTHGHSALASMLLGSVAEKVVRKAPCPVLTVRHPKHKFEAP